MWGYVAPRPPSLKGSGSSGASGHLVLAVRISPAGRVTRTLPFRGSMSKSTSPSFVKLTPLSLSNLPDGVPAGYTNLFIRFPFVN